MCSNSLQILHITTGLHIWQKFSTVPLVFFEFMCSNFLQILHFVSLRYHLQYFCPKISKRYILWAELFYQWCFLSTPAGRDKCNLSGRQQILQRSRPLDIEIRTLTAFPSSASVGIHGYYILQTPFGLFTLWLRFFSSALFFCIHGNKAVHDLSLFLMQCTNQTSDLYFSLQYKTLNIWNIIISMVVPLRFPYNFHLKYNY